MPTVSVENYLKAIYKIEQRQAGTIQTSQIAEKLEISSGAVSSMCKVLEEKELLARIPYKGVILTKKGRHQGKMMVRKHRIIELFLQETLGFAWSEVHEEAERLEHAMSDKVLEKLAQFLGNPTQDPHGEPIPDAEGNMPVQDKPLVLSTITKKMKGEVVRVNDFDDHFLRYMKKIGITLGTVIEVLDCHDFDGSLRVKINEKEETLSQKITQYIWITPVAHC